MKSSQRVKVYLDTNVILDDIWGRRPESSLIVERLKNNKTSTVTSVFTLSEILSVQQTQSYLKRHIRDGTHDIDKIFKQRDKRDLSSLVLRRIYKRLRKQFRIGGEYSFIDLWDLRIKGWRYAHRITGLTNILPADSIHLATTLETGCNVFLTSDTDLSGNIKDTSFLNLNHIQVLTPIEAKKVFPTMGIK